MAKPRDEDRMQFSAASGDGEMPDLSGDNQGNEGETPNWPEQRDAEEMR